MQRTFVVGCPRSGTTLVQAVLGRHPDVFTLPETGFFPRLLGGMQYRLGDDDARQARHNMARRLGLTRRYGRREFMDMQRELLPVNPKSRAPLLQENCVNRFIDMLDGLAEHAQRRMWIEKTPLHLLYLPEIEHYLPDARIIHVIRPGLDVLASITDAELRYGNRSFGGGLMRWAQRWNRLADIHRSRIGARNHYFVFLEDLKRDPQGESARLMRFLGLSTEAELDQSCRQNIADPKAEPWKRGALSGLPQASESKVDSLFGPQLRDWLREHLHSYEELYAAASLAFDRDDSFSTPLRHAVSAAGHEAHESTDRSRVA